MLKRARQHQIVERIFGSLPPSSPVSNLPPSFPSTLSLSPTNHLCFLSVSFSLVRGYILSPLSSSFLLVSPGSFFFIRSLSLSDRRSLHVFLGLSVFFSLPPSRHGAPFVRRCSSFLFPLLFLLTLYYATLPAGLLYPLSHSRALLGKHCRAPARETARRCRRVDERFVGARG